MLRRRDFLASAAWLVFTGVSAHARVMASRLPWEPNAGDPPAPVRPGAWFYFTTDEARAVEALADRIIPPDPRWAGGKDSGCAVHLRPQHLGPPGASGVS
jgi:gluconate 2-dehydrogenase gamma chain